HGAFLVLVGASGCGAPPLRRRLAGLEEIGGGQVIIGGRVVNDETPRERDIAMVFQNYALYPHMTVRKNIGYSLRLAGLPKDEIKKRVEEAAGLLELTDLLDRKPGLLSGGQRQRVAMGRAIVRQPAAYLMDEPLSNLDAKLRVQMRAEIARLQRDLGVTTIYVTHDQVEAMTMGTRVAVLKDGVLQQVDNPQALYDRPANSFVAAFIGSPSMNLYQGKLSVTDGDLAIDFGSQSLPVPAEMVAANPELTEADEKEVVVGLRPEAFGEPASTTDARPTVRVSIELIEALGAELVVQTTVDATAAEIDDPDLVEAAPIADSSGALCIARLPPKTRLTVGETIDLAVDTTDIQIFDATTSLTLRTH
ncbi:MAG: ATP-binding cassette domain-containing protein, partial [Actinomycetia bacterium]|nr:ATP-binding cassette domain-containing protein [Actinomycetes bacterium]